MAQCSMACDPHPQGYLLLMREDVATLHAFEIAARVIVIDAQIAATARASLQQHHMFASSFKELSSPSSASATASIAGRSTTLARTLDLCAIADLSRW
jgi:hypothetical protein